MKKIPGDIILYKSTINDDHIIYVPKIWCVTDVIVIFLLGLFFAFLPPDSPKNENFEKQKKYLEIPPFYKSVSKIMIICFTVPEI